MKTLIALVVALPLLASGQTTKLVTDFSRDIPSDNANTIVSLYLAGIRPLPGNTKGNIVVQLQRRNHGWSAEGHVAAANYNQKSANKVAIGTLNLKKSASEAGSREAGLVKICKLKLRVLQACRIEIGFR